MPAPSPGGRFCRQKPDILPNPHQLRVFLCSFCSYLSGHFQKNIFSVLIYLVYLYIQIRFMRYANFERYVLISDNRILEFLGSDLYDIYREWLRHNMRERIMINDVLHYTYDHFLKFMKDQGLEFSYGIGGNYYENPEK